MHLDDRLFTWSNERSHPTLEKINKVFITVEWEALFPCHEMHSLAVLCSYQAPLMLCTNDNFNAKKMFLFQPF
jgi:hypothetical protein